MSVLHEICEKKRRHVKEKKEFVSLEALNDKVEESGYPKGFVKALKQAKHPSIIAEVKKASPAKGLIRNDFDHIAIAKSYEQNGATCLSVLTDTPYFQGQDSYLEDIRKTVSLPLLRKDFMIDPYQIYESRALGADCILLILAALDDSLAIELYNTAYVLGMDILIETHDRDEVVRAIDMGYDPDRTAIGVNSRNLKTLNVDLQNIIDMVPHIPDAFIKIGESGIKGRTDIERLAKYGVNHFLIGEYFMRHDDCGKALNDILQAT